MYIQFTVPLNTVLLQYGRATVIGERKAYIFIFVYDKIQNLKKLH